MSDTPFAGDKKAPMHSPLAAIERRFVDAHVHRFPPWIASWHLTLCTVVWSVGVVLAAWLAAHGSRHWLWASSLMLLFQWFTDSFDGALGRHRRAGLIRWGYYMDHFLDFIFIGALMAGYTFLVGEPGRTILVLMIPLVGAFWVNAFLAFSITHEFKIVYLGVGPTEIRIFFALVNALIVFRPGVFATALPTALGVVVVGLTVVVWQTQRDIWARDRAAGEDEG